MSLFVILMLVAAILLGIAAVGVASRVNLTSLGLCFMALAFLTNSLT